VGRQRVIVVGGGIGGLVSALELAHHGCEVTVVEAASGPGGKLRQVQVGGCLLDAGPTVFTLRGVFDALFDDVGESLSDQLALRRLEALARHTWDGGQVLDLHADLARSAQAIGEFAGAVEAARYLDFCQRTRQIHQTLDATFIRAPRTGVVGLTGRVARRGLSGLAHLAPFRSMWSALGRYFHDPRLRQLFGRYATYCGSSPFMAPATLMLVAHVEQQGVWSLDGGMHRLASALVTLAGRRGATFLYDSPVREVLVTHGRAAGVRLASGDTLAADAVVFNGDSAALAAGLLGSPVRHAVSRLPAAARSLSAITWNVVAPAAGFGLLRHNVFFSGSSPGEFSDLFGRGRLPVDPTVYVCAQDRGDPGEPEPRGPERLLCVVNAPATADRQAADAQAIARCEQATFDRLAACGLRLYREDAHTLRTTPHDFAARFPGTGGALYGPASHGWQASFRRSGARSALEGLYLAGGSTHPGPGVPMAALSGRQAAASLLADFASTARRSRA
jgi:1-hydroxycarotenoid 3,4-desaturase